MLQKGLVYAAAAVLTLAVWWLGFRPGPGDAEHLLVVHAAAPGGDEAGSTVRIYSAKKGGYVVTEKVKKSKAEWKKDLTPMRYHVLREKGTERAFTGDLLDNKDKGVYTCAGCGADLFSSDTKFNSGTGWPSFYAPIADENVTTEDDNTFGMRRIEILCKRCDGHLGHVFNDGPRPTGLRYCVNSASLDFEKREK